MSASIVTTSAYFGSSQLETSTENQEIISTLKPSSWTKALTVYRFTFTNMQDCHVQINGSASIFVPGNSAGVNIDTDDPSWALTSFIIIEPNIQYTFVGAWK